MTSSKYEQNIVIDLEFTPLSKSQMYNGLKQEIIEIGAVRVNQNGEIVDTFQTFVTPQLSNGVARRISRLTGITDRNLSESPVFEEALKEFAEWVGNGKSTRLIAWSESDKKQIVQECKCKEIEIPENLKRWMDLQVVFPRLMKITGRRKKMSLKSAAETMGVKVETDEAHRALYDATVTAELLRMVLTDEYKDQKEAMKKVMRPDESTEGPLCANLGSMNGALAELYARLTADKAVA